MPDALWTIGTFSLATGLSIDALRHYDDVGVLRPAAVDPFTGYRRYRPEQVGAARVVLALRRLDLPVPAVRAYMDAPDEPSRRALLDAHRSVLERRARDVGVQLESLDQLIKEGLVMSTATRISQVTIPVNDLDASIAFYRDAFDAEYQPAINSFQFGIFPDDSFFLLTIDTEHGGPLGPARFGLMVADVDDAHRRSLAAGAVERSAPQDYAWKPRTSCVVDPSGNFIDLYQS